MYSIKLKITSSLLLVFGLLFATPGLAQQRAFDIPAMSAASSLPEFARQAGLQIVAPGETLADIQTPVVKGTMDAREALKKLLAPTHLRIGSDDGRTITLVPQQPTDAAPPTTGRSTGQAPAPEVSPAQHQAPSLPAVPQTRAAVSQQPTASKQSVKDLGAVTVTGSFIQGIDAATALPITTISQDDIALSGAATVSDLLSELPQSAAFDNTESSTGPNDARGDAASVNLRGLGSGNTLVLFNGHRIAPHPISAGAVPRLSTNINQIPLGAIERVEVLRDGASAIYGSDAVAGVVNTILKKDYEGVETKLRYGHVEHGGLGATSASVLAGKNFDGGRTNVMGFVGYYHRTALLGSDRDFSANGDRRDMAGSTSTRWDNRSTSTPYGYFYTGHAQPDGSFKTDKIPGIEDYKFHGEPGTNGVTLEPGSVPRSLRYDFAPLYRLRPSTRRYQFYSAVNHRFDNDIEATADAFYYHARSLVANAASPVSANSDNNIYVPESNYYNPFGSRFYGPGTAHPDEQPHDVLIKNYRPTDIGLRTGDVTSQAWQISGGLNGLIGNWHWKTGAQFGKGRTIDIGGNMISESRLRQQLALNTPDAFNPFGGPGANSEAVLDAVRIDTWRKGYAGLNTLEAQASGELVEMPGGSLQMATGLQYRHESYSDSRDPLSLADDVIAQSQSANSSGSRNVKSGFVEFSVPIFSESNAVPFFQRLNLTAAVRSENYSDFGTATKPKFGLAWSPTSWLLLRGSVSKGFRAPTLAQVYVGEIIRRNTGTPDPYRADVTATPADLGDESRQVRRGGNADLGPEQSEQHSYGFVLQMPFANDFSISADYFRIRQRDVIDTFGEAQQLALDFSLRESGQGGNPNVVRLAPTAADIAAFAAWNQSHPNDQRQAVGAVDYVRDTFINIARREVSGVDFGTRYRLRDTPLGNFTFKANVAYMDSFVEQLDANSPKQQQLEINGLPRVRGVASMHWRRHRYDGGLFARYTGPVKDTSAPPQDNGDDFRVKSWLSFNTYFGVKLGAYGKNSEGSYLRVGINNILDKDPPLADENRGYFTGLYSPLGRYYYMEWRWKM
ncbi:MAG: TonB-dependent receptor [Rhodanobacteraceae bacterium]